MDAEPPANHDGNRSLRTNDGAAVEALGDSRRFVTIYAPLAIALLVGAVAALGIGAWRPAPGCSLLRRRLS